MIYLAILAIALFPTILFLTIFIFKISLRDLSRIYKRKRKDVEMFISDSEIDPEEEGSDLLNFGDKVKLISEAIEDKINGDLSFVIGLDAPWGSGKSSFIKLLEKDIKEKVVFYKFNISNYKKSDYSQMSAYFVNGLVEELEKHFDTGKLKTLASRYNGFLKSIDAKVEISIFDKLKFSFSPYLNKPELIKKDFEQVFKDFDKKVVIVIDDLDRVGSDEARDFLMNIRNMFNLPNTVYIVCYDSENILNSENKAKAKKEIEFLEKYINIKYGLYYEKDMLQSFVELQFPLHDPNNNEVNMGIVQSFVSLFREEDTFKYVNNLRKIKRIINTLRVLDDKSIQNFIAEDVIIDFEKFTKVIILYVTDPNKFRDIYYFASIKDKDTSNESSLIKSIRNMDILNMDLYFGLLTKSKVIDVTQYKSFYVKKIERYLNGKDTLDNIFQNENLNLLKGGNEWESIQENYLRFWKELTDYFVNTRNEKPTFEQFKEIVAYIYHNAIKHPANKYPNKILGEDSIIGYAGLPNTMVDLIYAILSKTNENAKRELDWLFEGAVGFVFKFDPNNILVLCFYLECVMNFYNNNDHERKIHDVLFTDDEKYQKVSGYLNELLYRVRKIFYDNYIEKGIDIFEKVNGQQYDTTFKKHILTRLLIILYIREWHLKEIESDTVIELTKNKKDFEMYLFEICFSDKNLNGYRNFLEYISIFIVDGGFGDSIEKYQKGNIYNYPNGYVGKRLYIDDEDKLREYWKLNINGINMYIKQNKNNTVMIGKTIVKYSDLLFKTYIASLDEYFKINNIKSV